MSEQQVIELAVDIMPPGAIVMWHGKTEEIPPGWVLCDGDNGTPDLRNKFIIGVSEKYTLNKAGGNATVTLKEENLPKHTHNVKIQEGGGHTHELHIHHSGFKPESGDKSRQALENSAGKDDENVHDRQEKKAIRGVGNHSHTVTETDFGRSAPAPFDIIPPYHPLFFIMKKKKSSS